MSNKSDKHRNNVWTLIDLMDWYESKKKKKKEVTVKFKVSLPTHFDVV